MNLEKLREQLAIDEGKVLEIYHDHLGYPTFGIGHLILESDKEFGEPLGTPISEERVVECFERDVEAVLEDCEKLYKDFDELPEEAQQIIANMMFNMGLTRLSKFKKMKAAVDNRDWKEAAVQGRDSRWYNQVTNRAEILMKRLENIYEK